MPELLALSDDHYEQQAFIYLDIISWVTSKIENQSLSQVISRAYQSSK
ncbi:MAG: hypothetical protein IPG82_12700 [Saprospiraceae bacterium]|nr:hypothetical protein [Saprospiraceae bacterium]